MSDGFYKGFLNAHTAMDRMLRQRLFSKDEANMSESCVTDYEAWLRMLAARGGKGVVDNIDARSLGRVADLLARYQSIIWELREEHAWTRETIAQSAAEAWANYKHETPDLWLTVADAIIFALEHPE